MSCVTGLDMLARARAAGLASAFVLISGYAEFPLAQEALRLGAFDYLIKPLDEEVATRLLQRLATHLWAQGGGGASNRSEPSVLPPGVRLPADVNAGFQSLLRHVSLHYREPLSLQSLADAFNLNYTYCCELFRRYTGRTFTALAGCWKMR